MLIAILYTFPFEIFDRVINWRTYDITESRQVLTQISELQANKVSSLDRLQDKGSSQFLGSMFDIRIYNLLISNKDILSRSIDKLSFSESYTLGDSYALAGMISAGIPFYEAALKKTSPNDVTRITIDREFGRALFGDFPGQDIKRAREVYRDAFNLLNTNMRLSNAETFYSFLYEYGSLEMTFGDLKCGKAIAAYALAMEKEIATADSANYVFGGIVKGNELDFVMKKDHDRTSIGSCEKIEITPMHVVLTKSLGSGHDPSINVPILGSSQNGTTYSSLKDDPARGKADQDGAEPPHPPSVPALSAEAPPAPPKVEAEATPPPTEKPAPSEPSPAPTLRTPTMFDCTKSTWAGIL